jgi:ubiquinone/menaquinone biosynthesis C-methylase UbiE
MTQIDYVHGYDERESVRLEDQANTLSELLHHDSVFPSGSLILEAGCGTGMQTKTIARKNNDSNFISIDISESSLAVAKNTIEELGISNVEFQVGNIYNLQFPEEYFDHIFVCFVLEHLSDPEKVLSLLKRVLKKGGSITLIEGDHGSAYFHPHSNYALQAIDALVRLQSISGGDALIGRKLYPLLIQSGFTNCSVSPRMVYVDSSKPELVEGFTKNTFTAMVEGIRNPAIKSGIVEKETFDKGIEDLYRTTKVDGVFCYTFFKGTGFKK